MSQTKDAYIQKIRSESLYTNFRSTISLVAFLAYLLATLFILFGVVVGIPELAKKGLSDEGGFVIITGLTSGLIWIILGKLFKGAGLLLADIADSLVDLNNKSEQQKV